MVEAGFRAYLSTTDDQEICDERRQPVIEIKRGCSDLRRRIVTMLFSARLLQGLRGVRQIRWGVLGGIASGWITTPLIAAVIGFVLLFVVQNVFGQQVYVPLAALPDGAPQAALSTPFSLPAHWSAGLLRSPSLHPVL